MTSTRLRSWIDEAGGHDLGPAGIRVQRRLALRQAPRATDPLPRAPDRLASQPAQSLRRSRQKRPASPPLESSATMRSSIEASSGKQRQHMPAQALQAAHDDSPKWRPRSRDGRRARRFADAAAARRMRSLVALMIAAAARSGHPRQAGAHRRSQAVRLRRDCRGDAPWQHEHRNHARADDSQRDFLHAGDHDVEQSMQASRRTGNPSNCDGVAGQHEHVAARCAVEQREIQKAADPQRDREAEQFGRIHEVRDQNDRSCRTDQRSQDAIDRLRGSRPGQ